MLKEEIALQIMMFAKNPNDSTTHNIEDANRLSEFYLTILKNLENGEVPKKDDH